MGDLIHELDGVEIHPSARINVTERLEIGEGSKIHEGCVIEGRDIVIGNNFWMLPGAVIGGGSCFERESVLRAGHYFHMGRNTLINTARAVALGDEVGLGTGTNVFTHGAYLSALEGFPVSFAAVAIGSRVWLPGATVNPGVVIGSDVVVGVGAVVIRDIPSGSLAAGVPAKVIKEQAYPIRLSDADFTSWWGHFVDIFPEPRVAERLTMDLTSRTVSTSRAIFYLDHPRHILGVVDRDSETLRDEFRRHGIRFYVSPDGGRYRAWHV